MAYHQVDIGDKVSALEARYLAGEFSEHVLRASLYCLKLRGNELDMAVWTIKGKKHDRISR